MYECMHISMYVCYVYMYVVCGVITYSTVWIKWLCMYVVANSSRGQLNREIALFSFPVRA